MKVEPGRKRLFFALWPAAATAAELSLVACSVQKSSSGRVMREDTLHLTLAFLGEVENTRVAELIAAASDIAVASFRFKLDFLGYWKQHRILWAGCREQPVELLQLVHQLQDRLRAAGFPIDETPFTPHVTLARNFQCGAPPPMLNVIGWAVAEFVLVESLQSARGAHYHALARWPLQAAIR